MVPERDVLTRYFFQTSKVVEPTRFRQSLTPLHTERLTVALCTPHYEPDAPASEWIVDARRGQKLVAEQKLGRVAPGLPPSAPTDPVR